MKTIKEILNEVAEPKPEGEKRFKAKHVTFKRMHPAATEYQFKGYGEKDTTRNADYQDGEDEMVYESADLFALLEAKKLSAGKLELEDGTYVQVKKDDADYLNHLFETLSTSNRKRMESEMKRNQAGFDRILEFAREVQDE